MSTVTTQNQDILATITNYERASPAVEVTVGNCVLRYATPSQTCLWRVQTLATKEPDTIEWLLSFPEGGVFLDVGANVGMYSVFVGVLRKARVFAFEPEAQNYATLCRNIQLNGLGDRALAWCAALSDESKFDRIYLSDTNLGSSCHSFGAQVDPNLKSKTFPAMQGACATTIDRLVSEGAMPAPTFIKIDVDGFEHKVVMGAANTLRDPAVRSLLIEINSHLSEHMAIVDYLAGLGFAHDPAQFAAAQRKEGFFEGTGEYVFRR
jgi:FkbM family methyltransferase